MFNTAVQKELFIHATEDYLWLLERGYPEKPIRNLVGDRYRLSTIMRNILFRGISTSERSTIVYKKTITPEKIPQESSLAIDGYNVLLTCLHYRMGKPLFISTDGILRDSGCAHGRINREDFFQDIAESFIRFCADKIIVRGINLQIFLDEPVTNSGNHYLLINTLLQQYCPGSLCRRTKSVDGELKKIREGVIATSDSTVILSSPLYVVDLPRYYLKSLYTVNFLDLRSLS